MSESEFVPPQAETPSELAENGDGSCDMTVSSKEIENIQQRSLGVFPDGSSIFLASTYYHRTDHDNVRI